MTAVESMTKATSSSGMTKMLLVTTASVAIGSSLPAGFSLGVINAPQLSMQSFCNESIIEKYNYHLTSGELNVLWAVVVSLFVVGGMTGAGLAGYFLNLMGRKRALMFNQLFGIAAAILFIACKPVSSVEMLMLGRLLVGFYSGFTCSAVPVYLTEIAPAHLRGALGVVQQLGMNIGVLLAQILGLTFILGNESSWHFLLGLYLIPAILCSAVFNYCPESPKFLYIVRDEQDAALVELCRLRGVPPTHLQADVKELQEEVKLRQTETTWNFRRLISAPELRLPLLLLCAMQSGQPLSGINAVFFYSTSIFINSGMTEQSSQYATIGAGVINAVMATSAVVLVSKYGRRCLLFVSLSGVVVCLVILIVALALQTELQWMSYVAVVSLLSFVLTYGIGLGPIPYFIGSEMFQQGPKPAAMSLACWSNWAWNFVVGISFPPLQAIIGEYCFVFFVFCTVLLIFFVYKKLPETKDQDPADVFKQLKYETSRTSKDCTERVSSEFIPMV